MKNKLSVVLLLAATLLLSQVIAMPEAFIAGTHYKPTSSRLATSDPNKVEVIEMFSYACPHCFHLEPLVAQWKKALPDNVVFVQVPAVFRDSWLVLAKLYYAAEITGDLAKLHPLIFDAIHVEKRRMQTEQDMLDFVAEHGINKDDFAKVMQSFAVTAKVKKALILSQSSGITGVPAMIVNGQYITDGPLAGGQAELFKVVDFLLLKESQ